MGWGVGGFSLDSFILSFLISSVQQGHRHEARGFGSDDMSHVGTKRSTAWLGQHVGSTACFYVYAVILLAVVALLSIVTCMG
jgi:hypothetical protein